MVRRYAFYFTYPALARESASTLAAMGLATLILVPWLIYKLQWTQAIVIGVMLFVVGRLTKVVSPVYALRLATAKDAACEGLASEPGGPRGRIT